MVSPSTLPCPTPSCSSRLPLSSPKIACSPSFSSVFPARGQVFVADVPCLYPVSHEGIGLGEQTPTRSRHNSQIGSQMTSWPPQTLPPAAPEQTQPRGARKTLPSSFPHIHGEVLVQPCGNTKPRSPKPILEESEPLLLRYWAAGRKT